ncbi:MYND-type domain-containing protein [Rhodotorula toruloides]|uniref:MYND-type domain-containing protein n=1 Tax=Rhodotorula toruloides TaxID=5286 RepID=A0A2T0A366_RHOTO|nr:MYND-type domain-containing protein [Rhodotorula toruloides]PRQ72459.1 hypothetical protein AAT19DRAFT_16383 [Rhodotorula toruloides]
MTSNAIGRCLVCYAETKNRCSRCKGAGVDLFFCSPEHQKLAWPGHRIFCGPNAFPLLFSYLTDAELAGARAMLEEPNIAIKEGTKTTLFELMEKHSSDRLDVPRLRNMLERCAETAEDPVPLDETFAQLLLKLLSTFRCKPDTSAKLSNAYLLWSLCHCIAELLNAQDASFPWIAKSRTWPETEVLHRALTIETLSRVAVNEVEAEVLKTIKASNLALRAYVKDAFPPTRSAALDRALCEYFWWDQVLEDAGEDATADKTIRS